MARASWMKVTMFFFALACVLAVSTYVGAASGVDPGGPRRTVVLFPIANMVGAHKAEMADDLFILVKEGLGAADKLVVLAYDPKNVCVQRAVAEQKMTPRDTTDPFTTDPDGAARAHKVCNEMAVELGIIGSLDSYKFLASTSEVHVAATLQLVDASTGDVVKTVTVRGVGVGNPGEPSQTETGIGIAAIYDAAEKLLAEAVGASADELAGTPSQDLQPDEPLEKTRPRRNKLLPAMIMALIVGCILGAS